MTTKPDLIAYAVKDRGKGKAAIWTRLGAAWMHDGKPGFTADMEAYPLNGRIVFLEPKADEDTAVSTGGAQ